MTESSWNLLSIGSRPSKQGPDSILDLMSQTHLHGVNSLWTWIQLGHETMRIKFPVVLLLEKISDVAKNVKSLLEKLQVCIFAEIVFGVRCTLRLFFGGRFRGSLKHRENLQFFFHCFYPLPFLWFVLHQLNYLRYHFVKRLSERGFVCKRKNYLVFKQPFVMVPTFFERNLHSVLCGVMLEWACHVFTRARREHEML